uniref:Rab-GAP TBC domain-containing protein n=2 Tax=Palpitomonas bilix TaxID=652834 RepID=A0A7S3DLP0_9EUKA|mmetsp:Transcript_43198/g.112035  ORF Transcript_43198/g.112035 Transcript_43198/m.112035 type:complete len:516 (+) Transcript_43198:116-1663(+)
MRRLSIGGGRRLSTAGGSPIDLVVKQEGEGRDVEQNAEYHRAFDRPAYFSPDSPVSTPKSLRKKWKAIMEKRDGDAQALYKHKYEIRKLVRKGLPEDYRPWLWYVFSGASKLRQEEDAKGKTYNFYCNDADVNGVDEEIEIAINKDLPRTGFDFFSSEDNQVKLRRVLRAFAKRRPDIGYCQSMNFVGGFLLMHLVEASAFWTLCRIVDNIAVEYYDNIMFGLHIDLKVFGELIKWKLPKVKAKMDAENLTIDTISTLWFLSFYIHVLEPEVVAWVWDSLFAEGVKILFRVGLALLKINEKEILAAKGFDDLYMVLASISKNPEKNRRAMKEAFNKAWIGKFSFEPIKKMRKAYFVALEEKVKESYARRLARKQKFEAEKKARAEAEEAAGKKEKAEKNDSESETNSSVAGTAGSREDATYSPSRSVSTLSISDASREGGEENSGVTAYKKNLSSLGLNRGRRESALAIAVISFKLEESIDAGKVWCGEGDSDESGEESEGEVGEDEEDGHEMTE